MKKNIYEKIFSKALNLLVRKDYSCYEIQKKLREKFPEYIEKIEKVIQELKKHKYLDDVRFTENFLRYRREISPKGRFMLQKELSQKGIHEEIREKILMENFSEEEEKSDAKRLIEKKLKTFPPKLENYKKKEKLFRFLAGRGFGVGICRDVVDEVVK